MGVRARQPCGHLPIVEPPPCIRLPVTRTAPACPADGALRPHQPRPLCSPRIRPWMPPRARWLYPAAWARLPIGRPAPARRRSWPWRARPVCRARPPPWRHTLTARAAQSAPTPSPSGRGRSWSLRRPLWRRRRGRLTLLTRPKLIFPRRLWPRPPRARRLGGAAKTRRAGAPHQRNCSCRHKRRCRRLHRPGVVLVPSPPRVSPSNFSSQHPACL